MDCFVEKSFVEVTSLVGGLTFVDVFEEFMDKHEFFTGTSSEANGFLTTFADISSFHT